MFSTIASAQQKVYTTEHGQKYHTDINCQYLKNRKVLTIDIKDIGNRELCSVCKKRSEKRGKQQ